MNILLVLLMFLVFSIPFLASAHCPLCTAGAGVAALGASALGISSGPIGIFIGAFGLAMGLWIGGVIKKEYIPHQKWLVGVLQLKQ